MIGASKILTVSYGTFSCTLEGFDEPFNTMKAIAEYFRDLAAEDRYFGAEPPTPDAAMLHRIAEREIQRRVEAKIQDNGVILRAGETDATALAAPQPAPSVSPAPLADASGETVAARLSRLRAAQAAATALPTVEAPPPAEPAAVQTAAFETAEPEAAVELAAVELGSNLAAEPLVATAADVIAEDITAAEPISEAAPPEAHEDALPEIYDEAYDEVDLAGSYAKDQDAEDIFASLPDLPDTETEDFSDLNDPALDELIAAEVSAITAADQSGFAQADLIDEPTGFDADFDAGFEESVDETLLADVLPEDTTGLEADDLPEAAAATTDDDVLASVGALIANTDQSHQAEPIVALSDDFDAEEDARIEASYAADPGFEDDEDDTAEMLARMETSFTDPAAGPFAAPAHAEPAPEPAPVAAPEAPPAAPVSAVGERLQRARARVIKIRRADAPAAPQAAPIPQPSLLTPEAEAALQAELAALEAEVSADLPAAAITPQRPVRPLRAAAPEQAEPSADSSDDQHLHAAIHAAIASKPVAEDMASQTATADSRRILEAASQDDAVNRLIAHTNSEMDDEANRRRHAAISHLKAAVAATEAERQINAAHPGKAQIDPQNAYRSDLQSVVRPTTADQRPAAERASPLVLVSELRIDRKPSLAPTPQPTLATSSVETAPRVVIPVRPRRVSTAGNAAVKAEGTLLGNPDDDFEDDDGIETEAEANLFAEGNSFADFAEKLGANSLPELLEASAVYCAQVLGRPLFTRTIVMRQLETLSSKPDHSREDSLRVFGTLLRQGRIAKIKRGQFAVTDRSPLLAEVLRNAG